MAAQLANRVTHPCRRASDHTCMQMFLRWTHYYPVRSFALVLLVGLSVGGGYAAFEELVHALYHTILYR